MPLPVTQARIIETCALQESGALGLRLLGQGRFENGLFRILFLWHRDSQDNRDAIVYENKPGSLDTSSEAAALRGGSIVIHKK
jgi:hypothetical protein